MLLQRLQTVDCLSPCGSSSNKKKKKQRDGLPSRWLPARISGQPDEEDCRDQYRSLINGSPLSSDMPFTNKPPAAIALRRSSVESSPACRGGIPITPSPICSPSSFATPIQNSCMVSKGLMRQCSRGGRREEEANVDCRKASTASNRATRGVVAVGAERGPAKQTRGSKSRHEAKSFRSARPPLFPNAARNSTSNFSNRRMLLPVVAEKERRQGHKKTQSCTILSDDGYYTGSSNTAEYGETDFESMINDVERKRASVYISNTNARGDMVEAKLNRWKEIRTMSLMSKLREEEVAIDEWEREQTTKARQAMMKFEMALDKSRERAREKMQKRVYNAQIEAQKKKLKEQMAANKKISKLDKVFNDMTATAKVPWGIICL